MRGKGIGKLWWLAGLSLVLFVSGHFLAALYGLDPPYIYLTVGVILQLAAILLAGITVLLALFSGIRRRRGVARAPSLSQEMAHPDNVLKAPDDYAKESAAK